MKEQRIPFVIRSATYVAMAIAEEVINNFKKNDYTLRPGLLNHPHVVKEGGKESETVVTFRFEDRLVVEVYLYDKSQLLESWREKKQDWVVTKAEATFSGVEEAKKKVVFDTLDLIGLKKDRPWYHPEVNFPEVIMGRIGIFWDNASGDGYVEVNPDFNQSGHYVLSEEVEYPVVVAGSKEQALEIAQKKLSGYFVA